MRVVNGQVALTAADQVGPEGGQMDGLEHGCKAESLDDHGVSQDEGSRVRRIPRWAATPDGLRIHQVEVGLSDSPHGCVANGDVGESAADHSVWMCDDEDGTYNRVGKGETIKGLPDDCLVEVIDDLSGGPFLRVHDGTRFRRVANTGTVEWSFDDVGPKDEVGFHGGRIRYLENGDIVEGVPGTGPDEKIGPNGGRIEYREDGDIVEWVPDDAPEPEWPLFLYRTPDSRDDAESEFDRHLFGVGRDLDWRILLDIQGRQDGRDECARRLRRVLDESFVMGWVRYEDVGSGCWDNASGWQSALTWVFQPLDLMASCVRETEKAAMRRKAATRYEMAQSLPSGESDLARPHANMETADSDSEDAILENSPAKISPAKLSKLGGRMTAAEPNELNKKWQEQARKEYDAFLDEQIGDDESIKQQARMGRFTFKDFINR
jgi:hypothetical protein